MSTAEAKEYAESIGALFAETSALTAQNVQALFESISAQCSTAIVPSNHTPRPQATAGNAAPPAHEIRGFVDGGARAREEEGRVLRAAVNVFIQSTIMRFIDTTLVVRILRPLPSDVDVTAYKLSCGHRAGRVLEKNDCMR